jgi:hypothetical protein
MSFDHPLEQQAALPRPLGRPAIRVVDAGELVGYASVAQPLRLPGL